MHPKTGFLGALWMEAELRIVFGERKLLSLWKRVILGNWWRHKHTQRSLAVITDQNPDGLWPIYFDCSSLCRLCGLFRSLCLASPLMWAKVFPKWQYNLSRCGALPTVSGNANWVYLKLHMDDSDGLCFSWSYWRLPLLCLSPWVGKLITLVFSGVSNLFPCLLYFQ